MMFRWCSTETRTLSLLLLKLLPKSSVSTALKYFCTVDCRTKMIIKPEVLNCSQESARGHLASKCSFTRTIRCSTRFTAYRIIYFGLNCCLCYKAARNNAGASRSESRTNTFSVMAASICMQTFYPSPHLNPCFLSF